MFSKSTVKYIQSLQHKKFRDQYNAFIAEGPKLVAELLKGRIFTCLNVFAVEQWAQQLSADEKKGLGDKLIIIKDFELEKISSLSQPNKVLAIFEKKPFKKNPSIKNKITLVLDDIQDPGNLGAIIRSADWFGIENIICSLHTADVYNSKVVQGTMASIQRVDIVYAELETWLKENKGIPVYAATLDGHPIQIIKKPAEAIIIIGNEANGISQALLDLADEKISIPKSGHAESLNASVAAAIILYAFTNSNMH
ncbi:MAG TPA: RNA methyltransferase [Ferruginibacter sp.]|nr:RNA methyltransferase [Ferruginibacter sp.]